MTCETTRQLLLDWPTSRFDELSTHLDGCPACRELAERIRDQEAHVHHYIDAHSTAPGFEAGFASARADAASDLARPRPTRWVMAALVATAAAATLALALWGTTPQPVDPPAAAVPIPAIEEAAPLENLIRLGTGRSAMLSLDGEVKSISAVVPEVAHLKTFGTDPTYMQVVGSEPGRTMVIAKHADGEQRSWWIEVMADSTMWPDIEADGTATIQQVRSPKLRVGERLPVSFEPDILSVSITDPMLVKVNGEDPHTLSLDGAMPGTTDMWVWLENGNLAYLVITVVP